MREIASSSKRPVLLYDDRLIPDATGQCDACPPTLPFSPGEIIPELGCDYQWTPLASKVGLGGEMYVVCAEKSARPAVLNKHGLALASLFDKPRPIQNSALEVADKEFIRQLILSGLLMPVRPAGNVVERPDVFTSWLHLTDRCNLRCDYCYLPHVSEDMSWETGRAAVDSIFRSAETSDFKQVKIKYAGGEPLLCFPLVVELHNYAQQLAQKHGIELDGVVLSNGTLLTADMIEAFKSLGMRLTISLDGLGQYHDIHRPYAGGRGSFADVAKAVDLALARGLVPDISVTVSARTAAGLPEVVAWILDRALPFALNYYRENELSASHEDMRLDEARIINGVLAAYKALESRLPRRNLLASLIDRANLAASHVRTCGVGQNYLVFDQNGRVAKCQMLIRETVTDARSADPLSLVRNDQIGVQNIPVEEKEGCKSCEWRYWCAGGCPLETYRATGRYDVKSPNCGIYKALFPEVLRLEGLRLLKYADDPEVVTKIAV